MVEGIDYGEFGTYEWCEYHHKYELNEIGDYRSCGECGHVFRSPKELREEFYMMAVAPELRRWWDRFSPLFWAKNVFSCPLCGHDF